MKGRFAAMAGEGANLKRPMGGLLSRIRQALPRPLSPANLLATLLVFASAFASLGVLWWFARHGWAIYRLTRGVGDTVFYSADGKPWFPLDEHRRDVPLAEISPHLRHAAVAVEDHRFLQHAGIDPIAFGRATLENVRERRIAEGGSTLTQQLARTLFLTNRRTWGRKAKEAALALMLERVLTKDQILELYLNRVYLSGGVYGVEAMSRNLFVKPAKDLTLAESALVVGLIQAPSALAPWWNWDAALQRSHVVLLRMRQEGYITAAEEKAARRARFRITSKPRLADNRSGYAKEYLRQLFRDRVGRDNPPEWKVRTTFSPALQRAAEQAVADGLRALRVSGLQAALVALDAETGDVLAMVGGSDYGATPFNRAVRGRRQPGSAFKPFVYAAALDRGLSPVSVLTGLNDVAAGGEQEWTPRNEGEDGPATQTLREALLESNNQAAAALQQRIGSGRVLEVASAAGLRGLPDVPSLALGTGLVSPLDLTAAYAVFPSGGYAVEPRGLVRATDRDGDLAFEVPPERKRVLSPEAAFQTLSMLRDVIDLGTASTARSMGLRIPAAGKTGTTDDFKDAWFVGFSSSLVAGVWVGFDQPRPIGRKAYGARVALPIWVEFMRRASRVVRASEFEPPPGLRERELCRLSYLRPLEGCPTYVEYFKEDDAVPRRMCTLHQGSLKEEARRAVGEVLGALGRRLRRILER
ncbi:MAG TPA: PBP1A family penicillin-binding protein [Vicinamibacteria bacterium]|nr:PBP1A family penicillin-binding protein [Vicinamibacteria bacterium]